MLPEEINNPVHRTVKQITVGETHLIMMLDDKTVLVSGSNYYG